MHSNTKLSCKARPYFNGLKRCESDLIIAKFILYKTANCSCKQTHIYNIAICQSVIIYTCIRVYILLIRQYNSN